MIQVVLSFTEYHFAAYAGFQKGLTVVRLRQAGDRGSLHASWQSDIDGEVARYAFCKTFGYPFVPDNEPDRERGDVVDGRGNRYEIRSTRRLDGNLLLHPTDPDDHWAVLVRGGPLVLWIIGTILVSEGKQRQYWREWDRPCFVVPAEKLLPLDGRAAA